MSHEDFKAWAEGLVNAQTVHLENALRGKLATKLREAYKQGRKEARREQYDLFYVLETYILAHAPMGHLDLACERCCPDGGPLVKPGWSCAVHVAHDLRAARLEREHARRVSQPEAAE